MTDTIHVCDNCEKRWLDEQLEFQWPNIEGLGTRTEPGCEIPSGVCPECHALTYLQKTAQ
jgi:hypothetical protein